MFLIDPFTIGSLAFGAAKMIGGAVQRRKARKLRERTMQELDYDIPSGVKSQLEMAQREASLRGMPGQDIAESRLKSGQAETIGRGERVADSVSDLLGLYAQTNKQGQDAYLQMLQYGETERARRQSQLQNAMQKFADAEQQQFHYNRYVPFLANMGMAGQMSQEGGQMISSGLQTGFGALANNWMMNQYKDIYGGAGGGAGGGATVPPMDFGPLDRSARPIDYNYTPPIVDPYEQNFG